MMQHRRINSIPGTPGAPVDRSGTRGDSISPSPPTARPTSECEWMPFDLVRKRSGPHNLSRSGYDEDKCRNVLVRFCAHVPRNFQYKDGIQQIFLILREHLGDENLDLAGGVLYELIEVDCEHTDDPGAAFQRWRHDHMYRYADLELPHIPHMTTITASIIPTETLSRWRLEHADRYHFVLSDSSPLANRDHPDPSCIRSKKAWLIDHTLFVSTRSDGTRPMRSPNPKEFHEMQWDPDYGTTGKLVEERELPITSLDQPSETSPSETTDTFPVPTDRSQRLRHSLSSINIIQKIAKKLDKQKKEPEIEQRRRSWMPNSLAFDSSSLFKDRRAQCEHISVPLPEGCQIPNAIFARKFLIVDHGETLPSHLPISQMPTAEFKATETIVEAASTGLLNQASPWLFRGPFTPQLGFDGGLDYQWNPQDPSMTVRRFDLEALSIEAPNLELDQFVRGARFASHNEHVKGQQLLSRRRGRVFALESDAGVKACASTRDSFSKTNLSGVSSNPFTKRLPISSTHTPNKPAMLPYKMTGNRRKYGQERHEQYGRDAQLFNNIEFAMQTGANNACSPVANRQTTVVERPGRIGIGLQHP
ncbi:hypothetical protein F5Y10DRAFT_293690 [Nemania abortiva]|nr:hypothetical protein F5Y10DRAFT_293690 [Nemania abortiva]